MDDIITDYRDGGSQERQYIRTDDKIPVYYELLKEGDEEGSSTPEWDMMFDDLEPKPEENPKLYELLFDINQKLNMLINHLSSQTGFNIPKAREVSISGGGLRFNCAEDFRPGDRLILKAFLPVYAHVIKLKCEVVRALKRDEGGYEVAVKYIDMDETTRDKIIKYVFAKQREHLRTYPPHSK
ncbi:MAG: PilZ domain-containing protein [Deltaproteobacteria bacterium]|nr:PilZ domain-containing protein [Deltaproteobacteria bacterium]